jgi:hypothetical protein
LKKKIALKLEPAIKTKITNFLKLIILKRARILGRVLNLLNVQIEEVIPSISDVKFSPIDNIRVLAILTSIF